MRRIFLLIAFLFAAAACAYGEGDIEVTAKAAVVIEADSGRVLFEQNADEMLPMASTTKIMTALLAIENAELSEKIAAPREAAGVPGTSIYLTEGETLTLEQLLYGLMLRSGNDAATAIGIHVGGTLNGFVDMMNSRAEQLGVDASFQNPHGLDAEGHAASAKALAYIMREAMTHGEFVRITGTAKKIIPWEGNEYSRVLYNKNRLLTSYDGTVGGKTGYTSRAGRCLVFAAERDGMTLIGCVLNCSSWFDTAEMLLDRCFENYTLATPVKAGDVVETVPVTGGRSAFVDIKACEALSFPVGLDEDYIIKTDIKAAAAPVTGGAAAGEISAVIDGVTAARATLVYAWDVPENNAENALKRIIANWILQF